MRCYENDCCDCAVPGYPCMGSSCPLRHALHIYCDRCGYECGRDYYEVDGEELCEDCYAEEFPEDEEEEE